MDDLFADFAGATSKPFWAAEFGIDAYDNVSGAEDEAAQALYDGQLWEEIAAASVSVGGTVMEYSDEWWKDWTGNNSAQGIGGYATDAQPDRYANEEWWGLMRIIDNGSDPDVVEPRQAYYVLQESWR